MYSVLEQATELIEERRETLSRYYIKEDNLINAQVSNISTTKLVHELKPNFFYQRGRLVKTVHSLFEYDLTSMEITNFWTDFFLNLVWNKVGTSLDNDKAEKVRANIFTLVQNMYDLHTTTTNINNFWRRCLLYIDTLNWTDLKIYKDVIVDTLIICRSQNVDFPKCMYNTIFSIIEQSSTPFINHMDYNYLVFMNSVLFRNKSKINDFFLKRTPTIDSQIWDVVWNPNTQVSSRNLVSFAKQVLPTVVFEQMSLTISQIILFECNVRLPKAIYQHYESQSEENKPHARSIIEFCDYVSYRLLDEILFNLQRNVESNILNRTSITSFQQLSQLLLNYNFTSIYNLSPSFYSRLSPIFCGYWCGGKIGTNTNVDIIDGVNFSSDTLLSITTTLNKEKNKMAALNNIDTSYLCNGSSNSSILNEIESFTYSTETNALENLTLSNKVYGSSGIESIVKGYVCGGINENNVNVDTINTLHMYTLTTDTSTITLTTRKYNCTSMSTNNEGYICGGYNSIPLKDIESLTFDTETHYVFLNKLTIGLYNSTSVNNNVNGYICGGLTSLYTVSSITEYNFYSNSTSTLSTTLTIFRHSTSGTFSHSDGYIGCGIDLSDTRYSIIDKLNFSTKIINVSSSVLSEERDSSTGINSKATLIGVNPFVNYQECWDFKNHSYQFYNDLFISLYNVFLNKQVTSFSFFNVKTLFNAWYLVLKSGRYKYVDIEYLLRLLYSIIKTPQSNIKDMIKYCIKISWWDIDENDLFKLTNDFYTLFKRYLIPIVKINNIPQEWFTICTNIIPQILSMLPITIDPKSQIMEQFNSIVETLNTNYQQAKQYKTIMFRKIYSTILNNIEDTLISTSKVISQGVLNDYNYQAKFIVNSYVDTRGIKMPAHKKEKLVRTVQEILSVNDITSYQESINYDIRGYVNELWDDVIIERENNFKLIESTSVHLTQKIVHNISNEVNFETIQTQLNNKLTTLYPTLKQKHDTLLSNPTLGNLKEYRKEELNTLIEIQQEVLNEVVPIVQSQLQTQNVQEMIATTVSEENRIINSDFFISNKLNSLTEKTTTKIVNESNTLNVPLSVPPYKPNNELKKLYNSTWEIKKDTTLFMNDLTYPFNSLNNNIQLSLSTLDSSINNIIQTIELPTNILQLSVNKYIQTLNSINNSINNSIYGAYRVLVFPGQIINRITNTVNTIQNMWSNFTRFPVLFERSVTNSAQQVKNSALRLSRTLGIENTPEISQGFSNVPVPGTIENNNDWVMPCPDN